MKGNIADCVSKQEVVGQLHVNNNGGDCETKVELCVNNFRYKIHFELPSKVM